jgi:hypothetical protein
MREGVPLDWLSFVLLLFHYQHFLLKHPAQKLRAQPQHYLQKRHQRFVNNLTVEYHVSE